jgi:hypothetical protein
MAAEDGEGNNPLPIFGKQLIEKCPASFSMHTCKS